MRLVRSGIFALVCVGIFLSTSSFAEQREVMTTKAVVFDLDGTLIHNTDIFFLQWQYALQRQGYELSSEEFWAFIHANNLVGAPNIDDVVVKYCCGLLGRDCSEELLRDSIGFSIDLHKRGFPPIASTVNFLKKLSQTKKELGLKLGLASGGPREHIFRNLRHLGIESCFDVILSGCDDLNDYVDSEGTNKPKPYIYLLAAKRLGLFPEQCVAIEDSRTGISAAVGAGCITIAVPNKQTKYQDLSHAHLRIDSFAELEIVDFLELITNYRLAEKKRSDFIKTRIEHAQQLCK